MNKDLFVFLFLLKFRGEAARSTELFRSLRCRVATMSNANPARETGGGGPPGEQWRTMENSHFQLTADGNRTSSKHTVVLSRSKRTDALCVAFFFPTRLHPLATHTHCCLVFTHISVNETLHQVGLRYLQNPADWTEWGRGGGHTGPLVHLRAMI